MSQPVKMPVLIAIVVVALLLLVLIGYKSMGSSGATQRTDSAHEQVIAAMAAARAAKSHAAKQP